MAVTDSIPIFISNLMNVKSVLINMHYASKLIKSQQLFLNAWLALKKTPNNNKNTSHIYIMLPK